MKPIINQLVFNGQDGAAIVMKIADDPEDPDPVLDHLQRVGIGQDDPGTLGAEKGRDQCRGEDVAGRVVAPNARGDDVNALAEEEGAFKYELENGEEIGFFGGEGIIPRCSVVTGHARSVFHFLLALDFLLQGAERVLWFGKDFVLEAFCCEFRGF